MAYREVDINPKRDTTLEEDQAQGIIPSWLKVLPAGPYRDFIEQRRLEADERAKQKHQKYAVDKTS